MTFNRLLRGQSMASFAQYASFDLTVSRALFCMCQRQNDPLGSAYPCQDYASFAAPKVDSNSVTLLNMRLLIPRTSWQSAFTHRIHV